MPKSITVTSVDQIVSKDMRVADLETRPEHILRWFSNNILRRMLGYLVGWTGTEFKLIRCSHDGWLRTKLAGSSFRKTLTNAGTAADTFTEDSGGSADVGMVMVSVWDKALDIKFCYDYPTYGSEIELSADSVTFFDITCHRYSYKNKTAGQDARFEVVMFFR